MMRITTREKAVRFIEETKKNLRGLLKLSTPIDKMDTNDWLLSLNKISAFRYLNELERYSPPHFLGLYFISSKINMINQEAGKIKGYYSRLVVNTMGR